MGILLSDLSDTVIVKRLGAFVKQQRLQLDLTQKDLAVNAGVGLRTLIGIEGGSTNMTVLTMIQLLRALNSLTVLSEFEIREEISPLLLAQSELKRRKRASKGKVLNKKKSDW